MFYLHCLHYFWNILYNYRLGSLGCNAVGTSAGGPHVCCPRGYAYTSSWSTQPSRYPSPQVGNTLTNRDDKACGKPVVQGESYQGIGAHPWVVRIGFRSKLFDT